MEWLCQKCEYYNSKMFGKRCGKCGWKKSNSFAKISEPVIEQPLLPPLVQQSQPQTEIVEEKVLDLRCTAGVHQCTFCHGVFALQPQTKAPDVPPMSMDGYEEQLKQALESMPSAKVGRPRKK